jgi:hypothetical protein
MTAIIPSHFAQWAILEIMGHQRFAGYVSEVAIGGASMLRIDVPEAGALPAFTRYFGAASVYSISPVTEELARNIAQQLEQQPVTVYDLPESLRLKLREQARIAQHDGPVAGYDDMQADDEPY